MALILKKAWHGYLYLFDEIVDPRTKPWLLVGKPYQGLALLGLYLMFVLKWGPKWMRKRQPFNIDKLLIVYNAFQVIACAYLFTASIKEAWGWKYKWICEPIDYSYDPSALRITRLVYFYFLLKLLDLLDTVFFVLRKKFNQVSFLHIYHHTGMVLLIWGAATYLPGGHGTLVGVINSFVHTVMYGYYLLTVAMPSIKNTLWIKKLVTQLQILQFFWCVVHMLFVVFKTDCEYPRWTAAMFLPQNLFMLVLFIDFYINTYVRKPKQKEPVQNKIEVNNNTDVDHNEINPEEKEQNKLSNDLDKLNINKNNLYENVKGDYSIKNDANLNVHEKGNGKLPNANGKSRNNSHIKIE